MLSRRIQSVFDWSVNFLQLLRQGGHNPGKHGTPVLRDFSEHGKLREFSGNSVQPQGKIVTNKVFFVRLFKYLYKTAVDWVNMIIMTLDEGHYYIYFLLR